MIAARYPNMRILIVEDEIKMAGLLLRGLSEEGHAVDVAATGREAVIRTGATKYDAIILDLMLPDGNGFQVCRQLRQLGGDSPSSSSLPVTLPRT